MGLKPGPNRVILKKLYLLYKIHDIDIKIRGIPLPKARATHYHAKIGHSYKLFGCFPHSWDLLQRSIRCCQPTPQVLMGYNCCRIFGTAEG